MSKMFFNMLAVFAEFEADLLRMRTREGMAVARACGKLKGRQLKLSARQQTELVRMHATAEYTIAELMEVLSVGRATLYRVLERAWPWPYGRSGMRRRQAELDRDIAALLAARAFTEIRHLAGSARLEPQDSPEETLERIRFLANLGHNLPGIARPRPAMPSHLGAGPGSFEQATAARPMTGAWSTAGPKGQAWILRHIEQAGRTWTPPPPLPERRKGPSPMTPRQWAGFLLGRWPVRAPFGRQPLPAEANVLKALDTETVCALHDVARRLRLGLSGSAPWLRAHLDPDGVHYLLPDPASYYWPGTPIGDGEIGWWQCAALLRMRDGEQVSGMVAVLPEIFTALPSTLPRRQQLRLAHRVRSTERDAYLWGRDHKAECAPELCGYVPEATDNPSPTT